MLDVQLGEALDKYPSGFVPDHITEEQYLHGSTIPAGRIRRTFRRRTVGPIIGSISPRQIDRSGYCRYDFRRPEMSRSATDGMSQRRHLVPYPPDPYCRCRR
jgi:hypothetical protein